MKFVVPKELVPLLRSRITRKEVEDMLEEAGYITSISFDDLTSHPTSLAGYGITDAKIVNGTITLGTNTITPITSETDPTVPAWAKASTKPNYNLDEVLDGTTRKLSDYALISSLGTASYKNFTTSILQDNADLPTAGAVYSAIAAAVTSALHYRGMSSTAITDGGTETAIIGGVALVPQSGDVVIYNGFEFLWENSVWNKLGDDSSYALKTITISGDGTYITGGGDLTAARTLTLSSAVLTSLGKANSALQSSDIHNLTLSINGEEAGTYNPLSEESIDLIVNNFKTIAEETEEFTERSVPGVASGDVVKVTGVKGKSIVWNQIYERPHQVATGTGNWVMFNSPFFNVIQGHKYLIRLSNWDNVTAIRLRYPFISNSYSANTIITAISGGNGGIQYFGVSGGNIDTYVNCIDLTAAGFDSLSVSDFEALYPLDYYDYNAGQLVSNSATGIEMLSAGGSNLGTFPLDITSLVPANKPTLRLNQHITNTQTLVGFQGSCALSGGVYTLTGSNTPANYYMAYSDNIQTWVAGHKYYVSCVMDSMTLTPQFYFAMAGVAGAGRFTTTGKHSDIISVTTAATRFAIYGSKTANTDGASMSFEKVQIIDLTEMYGAGSEPTNTALIEEQIGSDYIPYNAGTDIPNRIYPKGAKSAGTACDVIGQTDTDRVIGVVDLGTLNWSVYTADSTGHSFFVDISALNFKPVINSGSVGNVVTPSYNTVAFGSVPTFTAKDKVIAQVTSYDRLIVRDSAYSAAATFKAAMSGVMLYYEQATPEHFDLLNPLSDTPVPFSTSGKQRRLPQDTESNVSAPMICTFQYGVTVGEIENEIAGVRNQVSVLNDRLDIFSFDDLESHPTTLAGYGITDAYTKTEADTEYAKYLPLTAGGTKPLTGDLHFNATSVSRSINWTNSSNVSLNALYMANGQLFIGYNLIQQNKAVAIFGSNVDIGFGTSSNIYSITAASGAFRSKTDNNITLGTSSYRWKALYATTLYGNLALSYLTGADDLKAIEALTETSGFLKKTAANTWSLTNDIEATSLKTSTESSPMFTFRQTPSVAVGDSLTLTKIKGKTLVWNQQVADADKSGTYTHSASTIYAIKDLSTGGYVFKGHKVLIRGKIKLSIALTNNVYIQVDNTNAVILNNFTANTFQSFATIADITTDNWHYVRIYATGLTSGDNAVITWKNIEAIDLTLEGLDTLTAAEFQALYPFVYTQDSGSLLSLTASGLQTTGKNIWDEEWEEGAYVAATGQKTSIPDRVRSKNYIPAFSSTTYRITSLSGNFTMWIFYYEADYTFIGSTTVTNSTFTTPANCRYINFCTATTSYGGTYKNDICINKSDTTFNGQYEPYKSNVARLDITTLKVKSPNIWDEEWESGVINTTTGENASNSSYFRSKNHIPIFPSVQYYFKKVAGAVTYVFYYDAQKSYLGYADPFSTSGTGGVFTTKAGAYFMRFYSYGTTYNNNICINLSNQGHNGHYYPHGEFAPYADGMKDAGTAYDELRSKSTTRRMAKVDLGTYSYYKSTGNSTVFYFSFSGVKDKGSSICTKFEMSNLGSAGWAGQTFAATTYYGVHLTSYSGGQIVICVNNNSSWASMTAADFKAAMSGVYLIYEQANPEDFELVTPLDLMLPSDALGTQRLLPENGAVPTTAPIIADIQYGANIGEIVNEVDTRFAEVNNAIANILTQLPSSGKAEIPTEAPANPENTKTYIYYDDVNHKICVREKDGTVYSIQLSV